MKIPKESKKDKIQIEESVHPQYRKKIWKIEQTPEIDTGMEIT
jgi:hypothetical protein